jgi:hypothetical protein
MKTNIIALTALITGLSFASAAEKIKAPNGGRIIDSVKPNAEFVVTADKKIEIRFLDEAGKVVAPAEQVVTVTMGDRANPTKLAFAKDGDKLVSDKVIPDGKELPVVLQVRAKEGEKAVSAKFSLNLAKCPTCEHAEYACTCAHGNEEKGHEGHDHKPGDGHKH